MRYFEYKDEKSDKFWQIDVQGCDVITCYGKIGSAGRESTKNHDTEEKAQASVEKLIAQKVKKGYVENASTGSASAMPTAQKTAQKKPSNTVTEQKPKTASAETKNTTDTIEKPSKLLSDNAFCAKPSESMVWDSQFDDQLPVMRGVHVPELAPLKLTVLAKKTKEALPKDFQTFIDNVHALKENNSEPNQQQLLTNEAIQEEAIQTHLKACFTASHWETKTHYRKTLTWLTSTLLYDLGLEKTLTLFLKSFYEFNKNDSNYHLDELILSSLSLLRHHIASADDVRYEVIKSHATQFFGKFYHTSIVICYLFANEQDWASQIEPDWALSSVRQGVFYEPNKLLASAHEGYDSVYKPETMLMSIKLNGLAFINILDTLLHNLTSAKKYEKPLSQLLAMLPMIDSAETFLLLAKHSGHGSVSKCLIQIAERYPVFAFNQLLPLQKQDAVKEVLRSLLTKHPDWHERLMMHCDEDNLPKLKNLLDSQVNYTDARDEELPEIFTNPPWDIKPTRFKVPEVALSILENQPKIHWQSNKKETLLSKQHFKALEVYDLQNMINDRFPKQVARNNFIKNTFKKWNHTQKVLFSLYIKSELIEDIDAGKIAIDDNSFGADPDN